MGRFVDAYDKLIMPEDCAQRIEQELIRRQRRQLRQNRQTVAMMPGQKKRHSWAPVLGAACLLLVMTAAGTMVLRNSPYQRQEQPGALAQPMVTSTEAQPAVTEADGEWILSDQGKEFLTKMCYYMPDWAGYASLNRDYWQSFLFQSFTSCDLKEDGVTAITVAGEADYSNGMVTVPLGMVQSYVKLAMNYDFPAETAEDLPDESYLSFEKGVFRIMVSDFGAMGYTFVDFDVHEEEYDTYAFATFHVYSDTPDNVVGTVQFNLYPSDNANGFTIIERQTTWGTPEDVSPVKNDVLEAANAFAEAYFSGDKAGMAKYAAEGLYLEVYAESGIAIVDATTVHGTPGDQLGAEASASVRFLENDKADSYTYLTLTMKLEESGWKVTFYGLEK